MEITAIPIARLIAILEITDLDPQGKVNYPELFSAIVSRYKFHKYPQKPEEFELQKGAVFEAGKWAKGTVEKLTIFGGGFVVETRSSTDDSEAFLHDLLAWAKEQFDIRYSQETLNRRGYVNQIVFRSDVPLLKLLSDSLSSLADKVSQAVGAREKHPLDYELTQFWIHYDQTIRKVPLAAFTIQRRIETPFSENKYFSEAPLPTKQHIQFLEELENDVRKIAAQKH